MSLPGNGPSVKRCKALKPKEREKKSKKKDSKRQEKRLALNLGGKVQPLSGADFRAKADVDLDERGFLMEAKRTKYASLRIEAGWLRKITREATAQGQDPAVAIELDVGKDGFVERDWGLIPSSVFERLTSSKEG